MAKKRVKIKFDGKRKHKEGKKNQLKKLSKK